ncbi:hypothetical protein HOLleu_18203 [Holothuria leucospilota]|uniref:GPR180/TMEM145 transmembrane domain-containing protein n=1 Tax=Holothuria leucospilota TaxID=206669 RepID=A0A9Q1H9N6_HOLLE|nr:hypothetical protein HOLleu_18203 [Holothuria leucospilota]
MEYVGRFVFNPNTHGRMLYDIKFPATCHEKEHSIPGIQNSKVFFKLGREGCFLDTDENGREIVHCATDKNMFVSKYDRWFYITFMNCHYLRNVGVHVEYKIQVLNGNRTLSREFSADESSNLAVTFISAMVLSALIILAIIQTAHVFTSVSNVIFTVILILIGKGYTITRLTIRFIGVLKIWLFVCAYSAMFISLYILKDFADPRDVRNIYDSPVAVGLVIIRFIALVWVFYGVCFTLKDFPKKRTFYSAFTLFITVWFLSEPLMILMSKYLIPLYCRAKVIHAMYLGTAIFGHVVFLCLTRPSTTNKFFPFHLRTNQVNALPFEYVSDDTESQKFEGGFYDMFMTKDERAKKNTGQGKIPTISTIVSEKETDSTTVTYVESIDLFPSSEKDSTTASVQVAKTVEQQPKTPLYIEPGKDTPNRSIPAAKTPARHHTYSFLEPEEDNTTGSVQAANIQTKQHKTNAYLELEKEIFPVQEIPSVRNPERMYPSSESESDEDLGTITLGDISNKMAAKNRLPDVENTTILANEAAMVYNNRETFPNNTKNGNQARKPAVRAKDAQKLDTSVPLTPDTAVRSCTPEDPAPQQTDQTTPVIRTKKQREPSKDEGEQDQTTKDEDKVDQPPPIPKKKKHQAPTTVEYLKEDKAMPATSHGVLKDKTTEKREKIMAMRAALRQAEAELEMDLLLTEGAPSVDMEEKRWRERKMQQEKISLEKATSEGRSEERRKKLRAREIIKEDQSSHMLYQNGVTSEDSEREERRRRRRGKKLLEMRQSSETHHQEGAASAEVKRDESKASEVQEHGNLADEEKEERRRRRRAKKILEKRQSLELHHEEDAASVDINKDERRKAWETLEGGKSPEALYQEGANLADLEKQERRRRRAKKMLEKRRSMEVHGQEGRNSAEAERDKTKKASGTPEQNKSQEIFHQEGVFSDDVQEERRRRRAKKMLEKRLTSDVHQTGASAEADKEEKRKKAWETPEENIPADQLYQEDNNLVDAGREERRRRMRAKKMLEEKRSSEVLHPEGVASAEAEREERRRRRHLRKNLEARRKAELEAQIL